MTYKLPEPDFKDDWGKGYTAETTQRVADAAYAAGLADGVPKWSPIESAPKDGTLVLIREPRCSALAAMFLHGWKYESGNICYLEPTHWMPKPAEPDPKP